MNDLKLFFEHTAEFMALIGEDGSLKHANPAFKQALGINSPGGDANNFFDLVTAEEKEALGIFLKNLKNNSKNNINLRLQHGAHPPITTRWKVIPDDGTGNYYLIGRNAGTGFDIPFEKLLDSTPVAMLACDTHGRIIFANRQAHQLFEYEPGSLTDIAVETLIPERFHNTHYRHREGYTQSASPRPMGKGRELPGKKSDGSEIMLEVGLNPIQIDGEVLVVCGLIDLTAQKRTEQSIRDLSRDLEVANANLTRMVSSDSLTNLKNRRYFLEQLEFHLRLAHRLKSSISVMMIDVDHFKMFNDTYGHPSGDEILVAIANLLSKRARVTDIVARYGGEEFVIILPNTSRQNATQLAEKYRTTVEQHAWPLAPVTTSIGVATLNFGDGTLAFDPKMSSHIISLADRALYHSKRTGRNRVSHWDGVDPAND